MKTIIWKGLLYNSLEYFHLDEVPQGFRVQGTIVGAYDDKLFTLRYHITTDREWKVEDFGITSNINNQAKTTRGKRAGNNWEINGIPEPGYEGLYYIDISLTPFTNTLPIRNLHLNRGQEEVIQVIYIDILDDYIKCVKQKYRRKTENTYQFENVPNDFEAGIEVDELGLVTSYSTLFERLTEK